MAGEEYKRSSEGFSLSLYYYFILFNEKNIIDIILDISRAS